MGNTILIIARHGNTFKEGEISMREGARTNLPLVEERRGRAIGRYLKENGLIPQQIFASPLLRTIETAQLAMEEMGINNEIAVLQEFTEIDYGYDENKTEEEVMRRLGNGNLEKGKKILEVWDRQGIVPEGWIVDPKKIVREWFQWAENCVDKNGKDSCNFMVTSNGIIRFVPHLTGDFKDFAQTHDIKIATGSIAIFEKKNGDCFWNCTAWNLKPYHLYGIM